MFKLSGFSILTIFNSIGFSVSKKITKKTLICYYQTAKGKLVMPILSEPDAIRAAMQL
jgi:hypothetical protein